MQHEGRLIKSPATWRKGVEKARNSSKLKEWPHNAGRHSFASYHLGLHEDPGKLAMALGIHDDIEFQNITEIIDLMAGQKLNADQEDYLTTLAELSTVYEDTHIEDHPEMSPQAFLSAHLVNIGMSAATWGKLIGIDRSTASRLLRGERKLNTYHIRKTAEALHISPGLLG